MNNFEDTTVKVAATIGVAIKAFFIKVPIFIPDLAHIAFSDWLLTFIPHLFELACAGVITGFCGKLGQKIFQKKYGKVEGDSQPS